MPSFDRSVLREQLIDLAGNDVAVDGDGELACMLIDSKVQHGRGSPVE